MTITEPTIDSAILSTMKTLIENQTLAVYQTLQQYMSIVDSRFEELRSQIFSGFFPSNGAGTDIFACTVKCCWYLSSIAFYENRCPQIWWRWSEWLGFSHQLVLWFSWHPWPFTPPYYIFSHGGESSSMVSMDEGQQLAKHLANFFTQS